VIVLGGVLDAFFPIIVDFMPFYSCMLCTIEDTGTVIVGASMVTRIGLAHRGRSMILSDGKFVRN